MEILGKSQLKPNSSALRGAKLEKKGIEREAKAKESTLSNKDLDKEIAHMFDDYKYEPAEEIGMVAFIRSQQVWEEMKDELEQKYKKGSWIAIDYNKKLVSATTEPELDAAVTNARMFSPYRKQIGVEDKVIKIKMIQAGSVVLNNGNRSTELFVNGEVASNSGRLYQHYRTQNLQFQLDTGAEVTTILDSDLTPAMTILPSLTFGDFNGHSFVLQRRQIFILIDNLITRCQAAVAGDRLLGMDVISRYTSTIDCRNAGTEWQLTLRNDLYDD